MNKCDFVVQGNNFDFSQSSTLTFVDKETSWLYAVSLCSYFVPQTLYPGLCDGIPTGASFQVTLSECFNLGNKCMISTSQPFTDPVHDISCTGGDHGRGLVLRLFCFQGPDEVVAAHEEKLQQYFVTARGRSGCAVNSSRWERKKEGNEIVTFSSRWFFFLFATVAFFFVHQFSSGRLITNQSLFLLFFFACASISLFEKDRLVFTPTLFKSVDGNKRNIKLACFSHDNFSVSSILEPSYFELHSTLSPPNSDEMWSRNDAARSAIVADFKRWIVKHKLSKPSRLFIDYAKDIELSFLSPIFSFECNYDGTSLCEFHQLTVDLYNFSFALASQVVEHLYDPLLAFHAIRSHLTENGFLFISLPTLNKPHMEPNHFHGFTSRGISLLLRLSGFEVVELGIFGCKAYMDGLFVQGKWLPYTVCAPPEVNGDSPSQTWALAQRAVDTFRHDRASFLCSLPLRPQYSITQARIGLAQMQPCNTFSTFSFNLLSSVAHNGVQSSLDAATGILFLAAASIFEDFPSIVSAVVDTEHHHLFFDLFRFYLGPQNAFNFQSTRHTTAQLPSGFDCKMQHTNLPTRSLNYSKPLEVFVIGPSLHYTIDIHVFLLAMIEVARSGAAARENDVVFFLSCRVFDVLNTPDDDFLWFCTPSGLAAYATRAGLKILKGSWWGTVDYAREISLFKRPLYFPDISLNSSLSWNSVALAWLVAI